MYKLSERPQTRIHRHGVYAHRRAQVGLASLVSGLLVITLSSPAVADVGGGLVPDEISNFISLNAPVSIEGVPGTANLGTAQFNGDWGTTTISLDSTSPVLEVSVRLDESSGFDAAKEVTLPLPETIEGSGEVTNGDSVTFLDTQTPTIVQPLINGAVRVTTVIEEQSSAHEISYDFSGYSLSEVADGMVVAFSKYSEDAPVIIVDAPWAMDSNGDAVETEYLISNDKLIQVVSPGSDVEYPIYADPTYSIGLGYYAHFNRAETKTIANGGWAVGGGTGVCTVVGAAMGGPIGAAVLAAACFGIGSSIVYQAGIAENSSPKRCLFLKYTVIGLGTPMTIPVYLAGNYRDARCK
ncbi:hypothetical protein V5R04_06845 [Jonesiaceae bacterium BS-20]|uniref:Uncharacterized protein n=1 Tax=Jonesiaceae bacterium BS-20 TaxID=3120821 RepID=A0AAU7E058_9MICO